MNQKQIIADLAAQPLIVRGSPDEVFKQVRELQEAARKESRSAPIAPVVDGPLVAMTHPEWVALCHALQATLDISPKDLALKARRLVESKTKYAREVITLEGRLLEKCPELDK